MADQQPPRGAGGRFVSGDPRGAGETAGAHRVSPDVGTVPYVEPALLAATAVRHRAVLLVLADGISETAAYAVRAAGYAMRDVVAVLPLSEHPSDSRAADLVQQQRDQALYRRGREDAFAEMRAEVGHHVAAIDAAVTDSIPAQPGPPDVEDAADDVARELRRRTDRQRRRPASTREDVAP